MRGEPVITLLGELLRWVEYPLLIYIDEILRPRIGDCESGRRTCLKHLPQVHCRLYLMQADG